MGSVITLNVVEHEEGDTGPVFAEGVGFVGQEDESLACGACGFLICKGVSTRTMFNRFGAPKRLVVKCGCGALNHLPSKIMPEHAKPKD